MCNHETKEVLDEETLKQLDEDFNLSEEDQERINSALNHLHKLCRELEVPVVASVLLGKKKIHDPEKGNGHQVHKQHLVYFNGSRPTQAMRCAEYVLENDLVIPEPLLKIASVIG